ncbi:cadmium-translocating P-type ATPase [bacterium]|nr:cadmium-translocating P-type ATPase [bacterium]
MFDFRGVSRSAAIAAFTLVSLAAHLLLRFVFDSPHANLPLYAALALGGVPLLYELTRDLLRADFGSDVLAGVAIVTSVILGEYLAGALVVLMLSGGQALESFAVRRASSALAALAARMPSVAHRKDGERFVDIAIDAIAVGDLLVVLPHEACPADGEVIEGHGTMNEAYLTGEPYDMSKAPGSAVISGAVNGESALTIRATRRAVDSRYAKIMEVMRQSEMTRPRIRRLADRLGALYTPIAVGIGVAAWAATGEPIRFLAVMVVATPCPLLIAIPVALIASISLSARRGIIIKDPTVLERIDRCRTAIIDKTGTLTFGRPVLTEVMAAPGIDANEALRLAAALEAYSKHPLAVAVVEAAKSRGLADAKVADVSEQPGRGLTGHVDGREVYLTSRRKLADAGEMPEHAIPGRDAGLEAVVMIDGAWAATLAFRDEPRDEAHSFVSHLGPRHTIRRVLLVSGDRRSEVEHLAGRVGITEIHAEASPEDKVRIVKEETRLAQTLMIGDGINDAPALAMATVGVAFGTSNDPASQAAGAVILNPTLDKVDELLHISRRFLSIALQSAVGGMALSVVGMGFAAFGLLPPVAGALTQEAIDVVSIANALRAARAAGPLTDLPAQASRAEAATVSAPA